MLYLTLSVFHPHGIKILTLSVFHLHGIRILILVLDTAVHCSDSRLGGCWQRQDQNVQVLWSYKLLPTSDIKWA